MRKKLFKVGDRMVRTRLISAMKENDDDVREVNKIPLGLFHGSKSTCWSADLAMST